MPSNLKALFIDSPGKVDLRDVPEPSPREGEVVVKMRCSGVCGTDIEKVRGEGITSKVLGHEVVGIIARVGRLVTGLRSGDPVFTHHHTPCYACAVCKRGEYTLCEQFPKHNISPCGFA